MITNMERKTGANVAQVKPLSKTGTLFLTASLYLYLIVN
jgi:hypothetical protein